MKKALFLVIIMGTAGHLPLYAKTVAPVSRFRIAETSWVRNQPVVLAGDHLITTYQNHLCIVSLKSKKLTDIAVDEIQFALTRPVIQGGRIYFGSNTGQLYCYSLQGRQLWSVKAGMQIYLATPAVWDNMLAAPFFDRGMEFFDTNGNLIANISGQATFLSQPFFSGQGTYLIYGDVEGRLYSFNLELGQTAWTNSLRDRIFYPVIGNDNRIAVLERKSGDIYWLDTLSGTNIQKSSEPFLQKTKIIPLYQNGLFVFTGMEDENSCIITYDRDSRLISRWYLSNDIVCTPAVSEGKIYAGSWNGYLYCFDPQKESVVWSYRAAKPVLGVAADKKSVYALLTDEVLQFAR